MRPSNNVGYLLQRLAFMLNRQSDQVLQEQLGIGFSQFKILMVLGWNPSVRQRHIADKLGQTEAGISRQIKLLKELGLLTTQVNPKNRREHITVPTSRGERMTEKAMELLNQYYAPMLGQLSDKQQEKLLESLTILHDFVSQNDSVETLDT